MPQTPLSLDSLLKRDRNNLDFIRFLAATIVIIAHVYPLSYGPRGEGLDLLGRLTHYQLGFGSLGVGIFFIISGFLITASFEKSKAVALYLKSRILRIFPGLTIAVLLTAFVIGPLFTSYELKPYFSNPETYLYLKTISLVKTSYTLPGVFESLPFPGAINGSLWTLIIEFFCYFMVLFLGLIKTLNKPIVLSLFIIIALPNFIFGELMSGSKIPMLNVLNGFYNNNFVLQIVFCISSFLAGMIFYLWRRAIPLNLTLFLISAIFLCLTSIIGSGLDAAFFIFGGYLILLLSALPSPLNRFSKHGDFSYGMYIYAFPIQQAVISLGFTQLNNFLISFIITLALSVFSWHLVEKPAMRIKNISGFNIRLF